MTDYTFEKTSRSGVETLEGFIPHWWENGVRMPVKLDFSCGVRGAVPKRKNGCLVYALPGGLEFVSTNR